MRRALDRPGFPWRRLALPTLALALAATAALLIAHSEGFERRFLEPRRFSALVEAYHLRAIGPPPDDRGVRHLTFEGPGGITFEARERGRDLIESWVVLQGPGWLQPTDAAAGVFTAHYAAATGQAVSAPEVRAYRAWVAGRLKRPRPSERARFRGRQVELEYTPGLLIQDLR